MRTRPHWRGSRGFTLIELVISTALMALILGAAYVCLNAGFASQKLIEPRSDLLQNARVALALMSEDLRNASLLPKDLQFLGVNRLIGDVESDNLDFATHNHTPRRPREGDYCIVSYFLERDAKSGQFGLWRRRDPTLAIDPLSGGKREEIAQGLRGLKFEYYDGLDWYDSWGDTEGRGLRDASARERPNLSGMPEAVRITLSFDSAPRVRKAELAEGEAAAPPLVFQTVARIEVAEGSESGSSSGASGNNAGRAALPGGP